MKNLSTNEIQLLPRTGNYKIDVSGYFMLAQRQFGVTGCIVNDSVKFNVIDGINKNFKPKIFNVSNIDNQNIEILWEGLPGVSKYVLLRDDLEISRVYGNKYIDHLEREADKVVSYSIFAIDSCGSSSSFSDKVNSIYLELRDTSKSLFTELSWNHLSLGQGGDLNYEVFRSLGNNEDFNNWFSTKDSFTRDAEVHSSGEFLRKYKVVTVNNLGYRSQSNIAKKKIKPVIYIPTSITPNEDNLNDTLLMYNLGFESISCRIYNSWGQKIWESPFTINPKWYPPNNLPEGVYVVVVNGLINNNIYSFSETIHVLK